MGRPARDDVVFSCDVVFVFTVFNAREAASGADLAAVPSTSISTVAPAGRCTYTPALTRFAKNDVKRTVLKIDLRNFGRFPAMFLPIINEKS